MMNELCARRSKGPANFAKFVTLLGHDYLTSKSVVETLDAFGGKETCLMRFLCARDGNLQAAARMFYATVAWRNEQQVFPLYHSSGDPRLEIVKLIRPLWSGEFVGCTRDGSPVQIFQMKAMCPDKLLALGEENLQTFYIWWMEAGLGLQRHGHRNIFGHGLMPKAIEIYDWQGMNIWRLSRNLSGVRTVARILSIGQKHYPENLRKAFMINAPTTFTLVWRLVSKVLDVETLGKISISSDSHTAELSRYIDEDRMQEILSSSG
jgi:hypothetical protein